MADQFNPTLEYVDYPVMDRGMNTTLPSRSMVPGGDGPLFRDLINLVGHDGALASWFSILPLGQFETTTYPTVERNGSYFETAPDGLLNGQCVMWQFYDYPQTWNNSTSTTQSTYGSFMGIVVTSREIYIYSPQNHVWYNATPVYSGDGAGRTVDVTAGGLVSINTGTSPWDTRKIVPGQLIQFAGDANWYSITSVLTGPDRLQTTFAGVAKVNVAYTIRRCFGGRNYSHGDNLLYGTVFNGDLYIAGRTLAGATVGPAVIRVNNIYDNVYTTEYLLAAYDLTGSMSTNGSVVANLWDIKGLQILPDGRVVIATAEVPSGMTGIVGNRLRYSSNTANTAGTVSAQEQWVASPAGFIDVVDLPGEITALGKLGPSTLTIHFHRGISLGTYTAQYDPPISIQSSAAKVGCFAPRTLVLFQGQEIFLGSDGLVHKFNGEETAEVSDETVSLLHNNQNHQATFAIANTHAVVDTRRTHYRLFYCDNNFEDTDGVPASYTNYVADSMCWIVDLENPQQFYKETYEPQITSAAMPAPGLLFAADLGLGLPAYTGGSFGTLVVGINSANVNADPTDALGGEFIYGLQTREGAAGNHVWNGTAYLDDKPLFSLTTDWLDFGKPGVDKTVSHVLLWMSPVNVALTPPTITATGMNTGAIVGAGPTQISNGGEDCPCMYSFVPTASEKWQFQITLQTLDNLAAYGLKIHRMRVYYQTQGEIEAANPDL